MKIFPRPRIVVSKCLEFDHCRYDGEIIRDELVDRLKECSELLPICPEMEIGLGVPRNPVRIVSTEDGSLRLVQPASEQDVTAKMHAFGAGFIKEIGTVEGYILKSRSPSCGIKDVRVYNPAGRLLHGKGVGLFGQMVLSDLNVAAVEDEGRLRNFRLREHFLITVFSLAAFRIARNAGTIKQLVDYHSANKYLFMAYNQSVLKLIDRKSVV